MIGQRQYALCVHSISGSLLPVWGFEFEVVSDTNELDAIIKKLLLKPTPVVTGLQIIFLIIDGTDNVSGREPPFGMLLIPNRADLPVIEKTYGFIQSHNKHKYTEFNPQVQARSGVPVSPPEIAGLGLYGYTGIGEME